MWMTAAPMWMASPPAMIATGISTRPLGTIPVSAIAPRRVRRGKAQEKPWQEREQEPAHADRDECERRDQEDDASRLWLTITSAWSSCVPSPAAPMSVESAGLTTGPGIAPVTPAR